MLRPFMLAVVVLSLATPAAQSTWRVHGSYEPDTAMDAGGDWMFLAPDTRPEGMRVYFNAVGHVYVTGANPNSDALGTRVNHYPFQYWGAYLGVWKDCNGDGYLGAAAGALLEYRSEALLSVDVCPVGAAFNDGVWVREFLWIGPDLGDRIRPGTLVDPEVYVWGDRGLPGDPVRAAPECEVGDFNTVGEPVTSPSKGTTASTGGMLRYADCFTNHAIAQAITESDPTGMLAFEDPAHPESSSSALDQHPPINLFGDPYAPEGYRPGVYDRDGGEAAFTVWDCGSDTAGLLPGVDPQLHDATGSYYHGLNHTEAEAGLEPGDLTDTATRASDGEVDHDHCSGGPSEWPYGLTYTLHPSPEAGEYVPPTAQAKRSSDVKFSFKDADPAQDTPLDLVGSTVGLARALGVPAPDAPDEGREVPSTGGTDALRWIPAGILGLVGPAPKSAGWFAHGQESAKLLVFDRGTLEPAGPAYLTFYAYVGSAAAALGLELPGGTGIYGDEWCHGDASEARDGFECDPDAWYVPTGDNLAPNSDADEDGRLDAPPAHAPYRLRDVDCFDNTLVRGVPAQASLVALSDEGPCQDAP